MISNTIKQETSKKIAIECIKSENISPIIWNEEIRELQIKYWETHGFNVSKMKSIRKQKEFILLVKSNLKLIMKKPSKLPILLVRHF
mgnify:CR=1 FL=1